MRKFLLLTAILLSAHIVSAAAQSEKANDKLISDTISKLSEKLQIPMDGSYTKLLGQSCAVQISASADDFTITISQDTFVDNYASFELWTGVNIFGDSLETVSYNDIGLLVKASTTYLQNSNPPLQRDEKLMISINTSTSFKITNNNHEVICTISNTEGL